MLKPELRCQMQLFQGALGTFSRMREVQVKKPAQVARLFVLRNKLSHRYVNVCTRIAIK